MALATLSEVRDRLQLPTGDVAQDAVLDAIRTAVEERILGLTRFTFTGGSRTEQQIDVQLGVSRLMSKRPILPASSDPLKTVTLQARSLASSTLSNIIGDIRDAYEGRIMPLASELTPIFPPVGGMAPWFRWRQMIWPVVIFTYLVDPLGSTTNPVPASLNRATVEWAASVYAMPGAGRVRSFSAEKISETYIDQAMPPVVNMLLGSYTKGRKVGLIF